MPIIPEVLEYARRIERDPPRHPRPSRAWLHRGAHRRSGRRKSSPNMAARCIAASRRPASSGTIRRGNSLRAIGLRADMDCLPMQELNEFAHRSQHEGLMHGCGHDGHTTMLLGAARYLAATRNFEGTVHFIFQPGEEGYGGGRVMVQEGLFEKFPCDAVFAMHNKPGIPIGQMATKAGPMLAASDRFDIHIKARGGHAAHPHLGTDPFVIGAQIVLALQTIPSRNVDPVDSAVISVGFMRGGSAYNVIPDELHIGGTVRSFRPQVQDLIERRIGEVARGAAALQRRHRRIGLSPRLSADDQPRRRSQLCRRCRRRDLRRRAGRAQCRAVARRRGFLLHAAGGARRDAVARQRPGRGRLPRCTTPATISTTARSPSGSASSRGSPSGSLRRRNEKAERGLMRVHVVNVLRPTPETKGRTLERISDLARQVEARGFTGLWVTNSFGRGRPTLDPIVLMSIIAAVTWRIEIGTCVLQVPVRHPVELAHRIAGLHAMTGAACSSGSAAARPRPISTSSAADYETAVQDADELARHMRKAWSGEPLNSAMGVGALTPWPGTEGGPAVLLGAWRNKRWIVYSAEECAGLDRLGALFATRGTRGRHEDLPRRRRQARDPLQRHRRIWSGNAEGMPLGGARDRHADRRRGAARDKLRWIKDVGFDDMLCMTSLERSTISPGCATRWRDRAVIDECAPADYLGRMALLPIITAPDPRLKIKARPVPAVDAEVRRLMDDMLETMYHAIGIGLAAPQVGVARRVLVIDVARDGEPPQPMRIANPEILWRSDELDARQRGLPVAARALCRGRAPRSRSGCAISTTRTRSARSRRRGCWRPACSTRSTTSTGSSSSTTSLPSSAA